MRWRLLIKGVASPMKAKVVGGKGAGGGQRLTIAPGASANLWLQPAVPKELVAGGVGSNTMPHFAGSFDLG